MSLDDILQQLETVPENEDEEREALEVALSEKLRAVEYV